MALIYKVLFSSISTFETLPVQDRLGHANIQNTMVYMRYTTVTRDAQTRQLFASHRVV